jgi:GDNF/GAS1 domain
MQVRFRIFVIFKIRGYGLFASSYLSRTRLEFFEQSCAVDSVTKKCAGKTSTCRMALLGILGTMLRVSCACQGAELQQLYDCLGWQRLLWLNPCVGESLVVVGEASKVKLPSFDHPFQRNLILRVFKEQIRRKHN